MTLWIDKKMTYDGSQLGPLKNYLDFKVLGDSIVSWQGPCDVSLEHMVDGEDVNAKAKIEAENMLHFTLELFNYPLSAAIGLQRLMGEMLVTKIIKMGGSHDAVDIVRKGDDLYWGEKKLNVSIATCSTTSSLIHFGVNIDNKGTPVPTCALSDFNIKDIAKFSQEFMDTLKLEVLSQKRAAVKVRSF